MRLNDFENIDELIEVSHSEFIKRANIPPLYWIPSRQHVYSSQCDKYSNLLYRISQLSDKQLLALNLNPSQFIKGAQDFQLAARTAKMDRNVIISTFLRLANIGMMLKRESYDLYNSQCVTLTRDINGRNLNGLLRAYSEELYLDDHTISGEFYGIGYLVVRSYKRMNPNDLRNIDFDIDAITTFCEYETDSVDFDCLGNPLPMRVLPKQIGFSGLVRYVDGHEEVLDSQGQIQQLEKKLRIQIERLHADFVALDDHGREKLLIASSYYAFKPCLDMLGINWEPSDDEVGTYHRTLEDRAEFDRVSEKKKLNEEDILRIIDPRRFL